MLRDFGFSHCAQWDVDGTSSLQQCRNVTFEYYNSAGDNVVANPPPSAPYSLAIYGVGYEPLKVPMNNTGGWKPWCFPMTY